MTGELESLDTTEPLPVRRARHNFDRLIMLSDGVFAIAITLLALDVRVPAGADAHWPTLWAALKPLLTAYSLSFVVISVYWLLHRRFLGVILRVDAMASMLNLLILGLVSLLPAGTRLASSSHGLGPGLALYAGLVIAIGVSEAIFWAYAALIGGLVAPEVGPRLRWIGFVGVLIAPPLLLYVTIETRVPPAVVPVVLLVLFLAGWTLVERLTREPQPRIIQADTGPAERWPAPGSVDRRTIWREVVGDATKDPGGKR
jgi:uncharacterized membrane protein